MIVIPSDQIQPDTLRALIEEFVTRDGAVHGHTDVPIERQIEQVRQELICGHVVIAYDEVEESCTILPKELLAQFEADSRRTIVEE
jgi:uncharacterized protein YheU (UPF0270 family)